MTFSDKRILCLCGGVGGAKLALGFSQSLPAENLAIAVNTGDDFEHLGFPVCPDIDTVIYTLAGISNRELGWGIEGETWQFMEELKKRGDESWFQLGDKDLETHKLRKQLLMEQKSLSEITDALCKHYGVSCRVFPMTDEPMPTIVNTAEGSLPFQHYFVKFRCKPAVTGFFFSGSDKARPSPPFTEALDDENLDAIVICPSNPFVSIDPILSVPGVREKIARHSARVIAVSPIIGGQAIKGPTAKMMDELDIPRSHGAIASHYQGLIDTLVIDDSDAGELSGLGQEHLEVAMTRTLMASDADKQALAKFILSLI
jgi:LPPG:FO 2-phospho-L-lactate transferase